MSDLIRRQEAKDAIDMALDHIDHVPPWVYDKLLNVEPFEGTFEAPGITLKQLQKALGLEKWEITMLRNPRKKNRAFKRRYRKWMKENIK